MADFDPKDRQDEDPTPSASENEKRPLGFKEEPAAPANTGRRLLLKFALMGSAAALLPKGVEAALQGSTDPDTGEQVPVELPYKYHLSFRGQPGTLSDTKGAQGNYAVDAEGDLYIDAQGSVFLSNVRAIGRYVSGGLNHGPISIVQPAPSHAGQYVGTQIQAAMTVLYSDAKTPQQPAAFRMGGNVARGNGDIWVDVDISGGTGSGIEWEVQVGWSKATC
jgi:hypothetical protein